MVREMTEVTGMPVAGLTGARVREVMEERMVAMERMEQVDTMEAAGQARTSPSTPSPPGHSHPEMEVYNMLTAVGAVAEGSWWTEKGPRAASTEDKVMEGAQPGALVM